MSFLDFEEEQDQAPPTTPSVPVKKPDVLGKAMPRIDGPYKTSGTAVYSSDHNFPKMLYAVPVCATIASGKIRALDASSAERMRGVVKVYHHHNLPKLYRPNPADKKARVDETRPPFEDETIYYAGQYVAVVVAETFEQATDAARAVKVTYASTPVNVALDLSDGFSDKMKPESQRGDVDAGFASAAVKVDETYVTPIETHNPIELHASVATYDGKSFTLYETTQAVVNYQAVLAAMLGVPKEQVTVVTKYLGSGFGGKLWPWSQAPLAAAAARDLCRPVKLVVDRRMMFTNVGHRPRTQQRVRLGATADGMLTCVDHVYASDSSLLDDVSENCGEATPFLYSTKNLRVKSAIVDRNLGTPTAMRGPGAVPGLYALESAMDELAIRLKMDPVELRLKNEPAIDEGKNLPFSSRHLKECLTTGAERFGWSKRTPAVGSMRRGDLVLGWGVAACTWIAARMDCKATVSLLDDGSAEVLCGTQDIGTGTYTMFAQMVHAKTGVPIEKIKVMIGNSALPAGPTSGGSWTTATIVPAVYQACDKAMEQMAQIAVKGAGAPFQTMKPADLEITDGMVHAKGSDPGSGMHFGEVLKKVNQRSADGDGSSTSSSMDPEVKKHSMHSYGAQFVEVEWDPGIARLRVSRIVSVIDAGRMINPKTARNQIEGGLVMGVGMGLFEVTEYDQRNGHPVNANLADYIMTTHADCPELDVIFLDYPDLVLNAAGARGVGEIGLAGVAPAITAAVYHATGVRVREIPVRIENLLPPMKRA